MRKSNFYLDEPCVVSFSTSELGWFLQRFQGFMRYLKKEVYQDRAFLIMTDIHLHEFIGDFCIATVPLPDEFYKLGLDRDCYEAVIPGSPPGSLTPPDVYAELIRYFRQFYNKDKAIEMWPPRGTSEFIEFNQQIFIRYNSKTRLDSDRPIITIFPRFRERASQRNIPVYVWLELVEKLRQSFTIVLAGTPNGACLSDYQAENVINLIPYSEDDKTSKVITALNSSLLSISSQSGGTHISLLSGCPSYIVGHEKVRHTIKENRTETPASFRYVTDYRAIDADTIISDVGQFSEHLLAAEQEENCDFEEYEKEEKRLLEEAKNG